MEMKLFGKSIFEFKKRSHNGLIASVSNSIEKSPYLPNFFKSGRTDLSEMLYMADDKTQSEAIEKVKAEKKERDSKSEITPKNVYELKMLNDNSLKIKTDKEYVDEQIKDFQDKLTIIKASEDDFENGTGEIHSILLRLENRKKYDEFKDFFNEYAYTTSGKIRELVNNHKNLEIGKIEQFIADMPKDAVGEMKKYEKNTKKLCDKKPRFYIIADKKDFKKTDGRKDPILLVQSPFAHVWQILGAWDDEMLFLEEI